jgi:N-acetyl-anhydromuramyl-L-alanine amidase AmpD
VSTLSLSYEPVYRALHPQGTYWYDTVRVPRVGCCLHYDGSSSDAGGLSWLQGLPVKASYNLVVLDDGSWGIIAPLDTAAWHAGKSRSSDPTRLPYPDNMANHAFYGVCVLTNDLVDVTTLQSTTAAWLCARLFARHGWPLTDGYRITTHRAEAWARGRKKDPEGDFLDNPIWQADDVRGLLPSFRSVQPL